MNTDRNIEDPPIEISGSCVVLYHKVNSKEIYARYHGSLTFLGPKLATHWARLRPLTITQLTRPEGPSSIVQDFIFKTYRDEWLTLLDGKDDMD